MNTKETRHHARLFAGWLANRPSRGRTLFPASCAAKTGPHLPVRPTFSLRSARPASRLALAALLLALCTFGTACRTYYVTTNVYGLNNRIETKIPVDKTLDLNATVIP
jgi:hypothetical protein